MYVYVLRLYISLHVYIVCIYPLNINYSKRYSVIRLSAERVRRKVAKKDVMKRMITAM